jgi:hypothetical protein
MSDNNELTNRDTSRHPAPLQEPDYSPFCSGCAENYPVMPDYNGRYYHVITSRETRKCDASSMRKAYLDYRVKHIDAPFIPVVKDKEE